MIPSIPSNQNDLKLGINCRRKVKNPQICWQWTTSYKNQLGQRGNKRWGQHINKNKREWHYIISKLWFKINYFENGHNAMTFFLVLIYFTTVIAIFPFPLPSCSPTCHSTVHPHTVVPFQGSLRHVLWRIPSPPLHHFPTPFPQEAVRLFLVYMILFLFCFLLYFVHYIPLRSEVIWKLWGDGESGSKREVSSLKVSLPQETRSP